VSNPELMEKVDYPADVKLKAKSILAGCKGGSAGEEAGQESTPSKAIKQN